MADEFDDARSVTFGDPASGANDPLSVVPQETAFAETAAPDSHGSITCTRTIMLPRDSPATAGRAAIIKAAAIHGALFAVLFVFDTSVSPGSFDARSLSEPLESRVNSR